MFVSLKKLSIILLLAVLLTPIAPSYIVFYFYLCFPFNNLPHLWLSFFPYFDLEHSPNLSWLAFWNGCLFDLWLWEILCKSFILQFGVFPHIPSCLPQTLHLVSVLFCCFPVPTASAVGFPGLLASLQPAPCCLRGKGNVAKRTSTFF